MNPPQAKPVRKRRRWLIVALLLVLVGVGWWSWPRGDARFVGKWLVTMPGSGDQIWTLYSSGLARFETIDGSRTQSTAWRVEEAKFLVGSSPKHWHARWALALSVWLNRKGLAQILFGEVRQFEIEQADTDSIVLIHHVYGPWIKPGTKSTMIRIPE